MERASKALVGPVSTPSMPVLRQLDGSTPSTKAPRIAGVPLIIGRRACAASRPWRLGAVREERGARGKDLSPMPWSKIRTTPALWKKTGPSNPQPSSPKPSEDDQDTSSLGLWTSLAVGSAVLLLTGLAIYFRNDISHLLDVFAVNVQQWGPWGYAAYAGLYTLLELLSVPAVPLSLTAGYLFGAVPGTAVVSLSATTAAVLAFLISRFALRDRVAAFAKGNRKFAAIDEAISKDGFKFVFLLRLSPLLPFSASNYLYGLTSIEVGPYALASWLGMLPGTWAYVTAGTVGRSLTESGPVGLLSWQLGLGVVVAVGVAGFVANLAKEALRDVDEAKHSA